MSSKKPIIGDNLKTSRDPPSNKDAVFDLLREISERPALNGGFKLLSKMQEEQCRDIAEIKADITSLKDDVVNLKDIVRWGKWVAGTVLTAAGGTILKLIVEFMGTHVSLH